MTDRRRPKVKPAAPTAAIANSVDVLSAISPPTHQELGQDELLDMARWEYDSCRDGIRSYNDHLFKIRSWSIALNGLLIAGLFGVNRSEEHYSGTIVLFSYTMVMLSFWAIDALNKSMQNEYLECKRHIERYLRGERDVYYIGPSVSLRFMRRQKRFWISVVQSMSERTIFPFYATAMLTVWAAILLDKSSKIHLQTYVFSDFSLQLTIPKLSLLHTVAVIPLVLILFYLNLSQQWSKADPYAARINGKAFSRRFFIFRKERYLRHCALFNINDAASFFPRLKKMEMGPYVPEYYIRARGKIFLYFLDRRRIYNNMTYIEHRRATLESLGVEVREFFWFSQKKHRIPFFGSGGLFKYEDLTLPAPDSAITYDKCDPKALPSTAIRAEMTALRRKRFSPERLTEAEVQAFNSKLVQEIWSEMKRQNIAELQCQ